MLRGFLAGVFWGVILIGGVLAAASLLSPLPATVNPQTSAVAPQETREVPAPDAALETAPQTDDAVDGTQDVSTPEADESDVPPLAITDSAPKPEPQAVDAELAAPDAGVESGAVEIEQESPVLPNPQAQTPAAPEVETELSISTNPAQPAAPAALSGEAFETPAPVEDTTASEDTSEDTAQDESETVAIVEEEAEVSENEEKPLVTEAVPSAEAEDVTPVAEAEEQVVNEQETTSLLKPASDLKEAFPQLQSSRLPSVGDDSDAASEEAAVIVEPALRPVDANAQSFENEANKPLMSIVLVDTGEHSFDMEALESFPYPLSIAVSTLDPQATEKASDYRLRGFEVLAMVDMPAEASASDVEQAMQAHLSVADTFVGVMEGLADGLQESKVVSDQVTRVLAASGHGLLMFDNGLNTAQKLAAKEGVPSAIVFRDFDDAGQTAVVMRRFLDQAAFKAAQENGVVMVGRLRDETISALLLWALQDRVGTVAMAPISAVFETIN